jgi:uncharacterized PurR-regulated membrane protein YhhQ (DUF165 family)
MCRNRTIVAGKGVVRAYKFGNGAFPVPAREYEAGPYRLRSGADAVWPPPARAYGGPVENRFKRAREIGLVALRLAVPVLLLLTLLGAVYLYADAVLPAAMLPLQGAPLTISDLVLPSCWTIIHLTNRRYGPGYAFAHLAATMVLALLVALINPGGIDDWLPALPSLSWRAVLAFFAAFAIANFVAIVFFDAARGPRWWSAPLAASAAAAFVFSGLYYPAAFGAAAAPSGVMHFMLFMGEGVLLLVPYCLLRPAMRPLDGRNGY